MIIIRILSDCWIAKKLQAETSVHQIRIAADPSAKHIRWQLIDLHLIGLGDRPAGEEKLHSRVRAVPPHSSFFLVLHFCSSIHVFAVVFLT